MILVSCCLYLLRRNDRVYELQIEVSDNCFDTVISFLHSCHDDNEFYKRHKQYEMLKEKAEEIREKHSYKSMLYSIKPLKLESWFTKEEIEFMNKRFDS